MLLILLELDIVLPISPGLMYWHVEIGITLALIDVFHHHIYLKGTKRMFLGSGRKVKT